VRSDDLVLTRLGLRFRNRLYPCSIGRAGLSARKCEGDGATPRGVHTITGLLYRPDRVARPSGWAHPIRPRDLWSDDPEDPAYNLMVRAPYAASHERLRRADPVYDLIMLTDWNLPYPTKGRGSAIFIHQWRRPGAPTEGCIGLRRRDLWRIACALRPQTRLIIR
jgi:L,D-peptidoglycan transpeptidase YkuD (ErfK/YbiS/YcfS/YnhG family)